MKQKYCKNTIIDLFLFEQDGKSNYSLIKNFNRLFRFQSTSRTNGLTHICKKCFNHFTKKELFEKQIAYCSTNETVAVKMPATNTTLKFKNHYKQLPIPFVVYVDLNALPNHFSLANPTLIILTLTVIKNTNRAVFVLTSKVLTELTNCLIQ